MSLEPEVITSIRDHRRKITMLKVLTTSLVLAVVAGSTAFVAYAVISSNTRDSGTIFTLKNISPFLWGIGGIAFCVLLIPVAKFLAPKVGGFGSIFIDHRLDENGRALLKKFHRGLDGACIATGTPRPNLMVVDIPRACSFPFALGDGNPAVALTMQALEVDLSPQEAETLMAHELSHILMGDIFRPGTAGTGLEVIIVCSIAYIAMMFMRLSEVIDLRLGWVIYGAIMGPVLIFPLTMGISSKWLQKIRMQGDLLADSMASKITSNPAALKGAILKLMDSNLLGVVDNSEFSEINTKRGELPIDSKEGVANLPARIANLEAIEQGHWPVFEG
jgi:Zn-dependent protease with chaperone function